MNPPTKSKINWTGLVMSVIGILIAFDVIPEEAREPLVQFVLIIGGPLIMVFRTWFTEPRE